MNKVFAAMKERMPKDLRRRLDAMEAAGLYGTGKPYERNRYSSAAGYDPHAFATFFKRLQASEGGSPGVLIYLSDHPATGDRITVRTGAGVCALARTERGFAVTTSDGASTLVRNVIVALPPDVAARLLLPLLQGAATALALHADGRWSGPRSRSR